MQSKSAAVVILQPICSPDRQSSSLVCEEPSWEVKLFWLYSALAEAECAWDYSR